MARLNDLRIKALKPSARESWISDGNGLYLRLRQTGKQKTWFFRYTKNRKTRKLQLGAYPEVGVAEARLRVLSLARERLEGLDPLEERDRRRREAEVAERNERLKASRETIQSLYQRWLEIELGRYKSKSYVQRAFSKDILPYLGCRFVDEITRREILSVVDTVLARRANRMAKVIFSLIRQLMRYAVDRGVIEADPTAGISKKNIGGKAVERDRVLSEKELTILSQRTKNSEIRTPIRLTIWIILATCCRISELTKAKWSHVDLIQKTWFIPPENSKNGKAHTIYLSNFALECFMHLVEYRNEVRSTNNVSRIGSVWIFPNRAENAPLSAKVITKQIMDRQKNEQTVLSKRTNAVACQSLVLENGKWWPHDLRRTGATLMVANGVLPEIAERCLNHTEKNTLRRVYQVHRYQKEMQAAWCVLGGVLEGIRSRIVLSRLDQPVNREGNYK
jgi:integrase